MLSTILFITSSLQICRTGGSKLASADGDGPAITASTGGGENPAHLLSAEPRYRPPDRFARPGRARRARDAAPIQFERDLPRRRAAHLVDHRLDALRRLLALASLNLTRRDWSQRWLQRSHHRFWRQQLATAHSRRTQKDHKMLEVPWHKTPSTRRREILVPTSAASFQDGRPIRSENRALLVASIARGRRWLDELITDPKVGTESIASREGCTVRQVNMTISLAFLAPSLVAAAIEGRLPHGMGVTRLRDFPAEWSRQGQMLGL